MKKILIGLWILYEDPQSGLLTFEHIDMKIAMVLWML